MKLSVFLGLVIVLVSFAGEMSSAKMYWEGGSDTENTITAKDFQAKLPGRQVTTPSVKMYDDFEVMDIRPEQEKRQVAPPAARPGRTRAGTRPGFLPDEPQRRSTPATTAAGPRRTGATRAEPTQSITDKPRPVGSTPGKGPKSEGEPTRADTQTQTSGKTETTSPPVTKKMPWGQVDVKPAEPEEKKLKWGE